MVGSPIIIDSKRGGYWTMKYAKFNHINICSGRFPQIIVHSLQARTTHKKVCYYIICICTVLSTVNEFLKCSVYNMYYEY